MSDLWKVPYNEGMKQGIVQGIEQGIHQGIHQGIEQGIHQGIVQGKESTLLRCIKNLCKQYHITILQAMDSLGVDEEDRDHLISLLNE